MVREIKAKYDYVSLSFSLTSSDKRLLPGKINRFIFRDRVGSSFPTWVYIPKKVDVKTAPILVMVHGAKRGAHRYLKEWQALAQQKGIIVIFR